MVAGGAEVGADEAVPGGGADAAPAAASDKVSGLVQDFIAQLRTITQGLEGLAGSGEHRPPAPGGFPLPGALSAAQLTSIASSVAAQQRCIEALQAQLSSFDEQLAVLEQILAPLAEWSSTWAELEHRLLTMGREPPAQSGPAVPDRRATAVVVPALRCASSHRQLATSQHRKCAPGEAAPDLRQVRMFVGHYFAARSPLANASSRSVGWVPREVIWRGEVVAPAQRL